MAKEGYHMNDKQRDQIIDDLLLKRPKGDKGISVTYTTTREYDYSRNRYVEDLVSSHVSWGYDDMTLFQLGFFTIEDVKHYVLRRWFEGKNRWELGRTYSTVTRRTNRIWNRIESSLTRVKHEGAKGIYKITERYRSGPLGHVFADTPKEAMVLFATFFPKDNTRGDVKAEFVELGNPMGLLERNNEVRRQSVEDIKRMRESIRRNQEQIQKLENYVEMLTVLEGHQLAVEVQ